MTSLRSVALPRGVTGLCKHDVTALTRPDLRAFQTVLFEAARFENGRVSRKPTEGGSGVCCNFYSGFVEQADSTVVVLLNRHYPFIAFSRPHEADGVRMLPQFIDQQSLYPHFARSDRAYIVLSKVALEKPVESENLRNLCPAELKVIRYWQPATVGQVIFNYWD